MNLANAQTTLRDRLQAASGLSGLSILIDDPEAVNPTYDTDVEAALHGKGVAITVGVDLSGGSDRASTMGETVLDVRYPIYVIQNTPVRKADVPSSSFGALCDAVVQAFIASDDTEVVDISEISESDGGLLLRIIVIAAEITYTH